MQPMLQGVLLARRDLNVVKHLPMMIAAMIWLLMNALSLSISMSALLKHVFMWYPHDLGYLFWHTVGHSALSNSPAVDSSCVDGAQHNDVTRFRVCQVPQEFVARCRSKSTLLRVQALEPWQVLNRSVFWCPDARTRSPQTAGLRTVSKSCQTRGEICEEGTPNHDNP